jgi:hypothetical protein
MTSLSEPGTKMLQEIGQEAAVYLGLRRDRSIITATAVNLDLQERIFILVDGWGLSLDGSRFWVIDINRSWQAYTIQTIEEEYARQFMMLLLEITP